MSPWLRPGVTAALQRPPAAVVVLTGTVRPAAARPSGALNVTVTVAPSGAPVELAADAQRLVHHAARRALLGERRRRRRRRLRRLRRSRRRRLRHAADRREDRLRVIAVDRDLQLAGLDRAVAEQRRDDAAEALADHLAVAQQRYRLAGERGRQQQPDLPRRRVGTGSGTGDLGREYRLYRRRVYEYRRRARRPTSASSGRRSSATGTAPGGRRRWFSVRRARRAGPCR